MAIIIIIVPSEIIMRHPYKWILVHSVVLTNSEVLFVQLNFLGKFADYSDYSDLFMQWTVFIGVLVFAAILIAVL